MKDRSVEKTAAGLRKLTSEIYVPRHAYRSVDAMQFKHLDLKFYDRVRDAVLQAGGTCFGDVENVTLNRGFLNPRTFGRCMVTEDHTTSIGCYHVRFRLPAQILVRLLGMKSWKNMDCETELSNGHFMLTSNAAEAGRLNSPPTIHAEYLPNHTSLEQLMSRHQDRLQTHLLEHPGLDPVCVYSMEEGLASQHRMEVVKAAYRASLGLVSEDELIRNGADPASARSIKAAMERQAGALSLPDTSTEPSAQSVPVR